MQRRYSQQVRAIVNALTLPDPWDVSQLCTDVARRRGRRIEVRARPSMGDEITGCVFRQHDVDVIFYRDDLDLDPLYKEHVLCHELGHLLAGHLEGPNAYPGGADDDLAAAAKIMLHRRQCMYGESREREAEQIANLILSRVRQRVPGIDRATQRAVRGFAAAVR